MTVEENRGRWITMGIAAFVAVPPLLTTLLVLTLGQPVPGQLWFRLALGSVLALLLVMGYTWARAYIGYVLSIGSVLLNLGTLLRSPLLGILTIPFTALNVAAAVILWKSKSVDAYFARQTHRRDDLPSLKELDQ